MHADTYLYNELTKTLNDLNQMEESITRQIRTEVPLKVEVTRGMLLSRRYASDGKYIMSDILSAKAECLSAMAALKTNQRKK